MYSPKHPSDKGRYTLKTPRPLNNWKKSNDAFPFSLWTSTARPFMAVNLHPTRIYAYIYICKYVCVCEYIYIYRKNLIAMWISARDLAICTNINIQIPVIRHLIIWPKMIKAKKDTCKRNCSSMQVGANWSNVHMFHPNPAWVRLDERSTVPNVTARNAWEQHWSTHFGPWKWRTPSRPTNPSLADLFTSLSLRLMSSNMYAL